MSLIGEEIIQANWFLPLIKQSPCSGFSNSAGCNGIPHLIRVRDNFEIPSILEPEWKLTTELAPSLNKSLTNLAETLAPEVGLESGLRIIFYALFLFLLGDRAGAGESLRFP